MDKYSPYFNFDKDAFDMYRSEDGDYVLYEDYQKLEAENAKLTDKCHDYLMEINKLCEALEDIFDLYESTDNEGLNDAIERHQKALEDPIPDGVYNALTI